MDSENIPKVSTKAEKLKKFLDLGAQHSFSGYVDMVSKGHNGSTYDIVIRNDGCAMLYIDDKDQVWFAKQFRVPMQREIFEVAGETIDKPGEDIFDRVMGGLAEEYGIKVQESQIEFVAALATSVGMDTEIQYLYIVKGAHTFVGQNLDDSEEIYVVRIPFDEAYTMLKRGEIIDARTAFLLQAEYISRLESK